MVDLATAQSVLRGLHTPVSEVTNGFSIARGNQQFVIRNDDLEHYLSIRSRIQRDLETQIYFPGYYEHVVRFESDRLRRSPRGDEDLIKLESPDGQTSVNVGQVSVVFCLSLTDADNISTQLRRFFFLSMGVGRNGIERPINEFFRLKSIKVSANSETSIGRNVARLHEIAEAAAFHIAFGQGSSISFTKSWERTYYWLGRKQEEVQFPRRIYNSELVSYYSLALASDSLVLAYLALYNILEFFYTSVSENAIHEKLKEQLVAPDFTHTKPKKLRDLVKTIRQFDAKLDEANSLKLVISTHFEKSTLRDWVNDYETKNGLYYTVAIPIFGSTQRLDINDASIIPNLATRIYLIRNALVHNKEGETSRFVPYSGQEEMLAKEIQILLFLAEQLIVKTGKDIMY